MAKLAPAQTRFDWKKVLSALKNVLYVLLLLLCAFLLVLVVWLSVDKFIIQSPIPSFAGYSLLSVESGSMEGDMEDSIDEKDLILIRKSSNYMIGETITYLRPSDHVPTTHRIIDYEEVNGKREYITRGDANGSSKDATVTEDMIFGKVVFIFKGVGEFREFITEGGGYVFLITFAIILIAGTTAYKMLDKKGNPHSQSDNPKEKTQTEHDTQVNKEE